MTTPGNPYSLTVRGQRAEVELGVAGRTNTAALIVDGVRVAQHEVGLWETATLETEGVKVEATWWWFGRPRSVVLLDAVPAPVAGMPDVVDRIPFDPPPGTRAARTARFEREHPRLFASRHVVLVLAKIAASVAGLSLAVSFLLRWIDWSWLPSFSFDWLPEWSLWGWLPDWSLWGWLPDLSLPDWLAWLFEPPVSEWLRWVGAVVVGIGVAVREVRRRRSRAERLAAPTTTGEARCEPSTPSSTPPAGDTSPRPQQSASPATGSSERPPPRSAPRPE